MPASVRPSQASSSDPGVSAPAARRRTTRPRASNTTSARGRTVRRLTAGALAPGALELAWDGRTDAGMPAPAGLYFAVLEGARERVATRLVRIRAE